MNMYVILDFFCVIHFDALTCAMKVFHFISQIGHRQANGSSGWLIQWEWLIAFLHLTAHSNYYCYYLNQHETYNGGKRTRLHIKYIFWWIGAFVVVIQWEEEWKKWRNHRLEKKWAHAQVLSPKTCCKFIYVQIRHSFADTEPRTFP